MPQRTMERRRRRHEEDEEPEEDTRARSRDDDDDEGDEEPRGRRQRGRSRRADVEDDESGEDEPRSRSRRSRREEDEDEEPQGRRRGGREKQTKSSAKIGRGWGGYHDVKDAGSDYVKMWEVPKKSTLIKFLEPEPFATFVEHWLDGITKGKRSFICLGEDCPLCDDLSDSPRGYALFNILDLSDPDHPKVEVWKAGRRVGNILEEYAKDKKTGPLDRVDQYFSVFKSGEKGGNVQTNINPVKARDLEDDWDCEPFDEDELDAFDLYTEEQVVVTTPRKELKRIAADYED